MQRYTITQFNQDFPDDDACLEWLKDYRWPDGIHCVNCGKVTKHHRMSTRKSYSCQECGHHVHPTAGTIFHKSRTPLKLWFYAVYVMAATRGGISAKQIERETGVTYKTAWRMFNKIRSRLDDGSDPLSGTVEVDETYIGGKRRGGKRGRGAPGKTVAIGLAERKGRIRAVKAENVRAATVLPIVRSHVLPRSTVYTDELASYNRLTKMGYAHGRIHHAAKVYVMGAVHTNNIEGFWSQFKRGVSDVYHAISAKYLQHYLNEYAFRYNHRGDREPMFRTMLRRVGLPLGGQPS